jgi:hypothetical protein|tara:strand:+ start:476 stop:937 length:462 start_codon:yes stop_codon:yes gene_type:complete
VFIVCVSSIPDSSKIIVVTGQRGSQIRDVKNFRAMIVSFFESLLFEKNPSEYTLIHGCCDGADLMAAQIASDLGLTVIGIPADWTRYGRAAGPIRNRLMLEYKPFIVAAFHENIKSSKGTKNTVVTALEMDLVVWVSWKNKNPSGSLKDSEGL